MKIRGKEYSKTLQKNLKTKRNKDSLKKRNKEKKIDIKGSLQNIKNLKIDLKVSIEVDQGHIKDL